MPPYRPQTPRKSWLPWAKFGIGTLLVVGAGWGVLEVAQRYMGLQKLTIEQVTVIGCQGDRLTEVQRIADEICLGKPLFWFDADGLRERVEQRRWVRGLLIRRDPPDRLSLVVEERTPLLWLVKSSGIYLVSDDGIVLDRLSQSGATPMPVIADPTSQKDETLVQLIRTASALRALVPNDFFQRVVELRWTPAGPEAFIEGVQAPLRLSKVDPGRNVANFQAVFLTDYANTPRLQGVRYFDLRWEGEVVVGEAETQAPPTGITR